MKPLRNNSYLVVYIVTLLPLLLAFVVLSDVVVDNYRMLRAFDVDESGVLVDLQRMYDQGTWKPFNYIYGTSHTYICLLILKVVGVLKPVTFETIALVGRSVNLAAFAATGGLLLLWAKERMSVKWALLMLFSFFYVSTNFRYALNAKPEHLQTFFLVSSFFCFDEFLRCSRSRFLFAAGLFGGFAFATKYAGLLLIFFLIFYLFADHVLREKGLCRLNLFVRRVSLLLGGGLLGVALLGPYLLIDLPIVLQVLSIQSGIIGAGYFSLESKSLLGWLQLLLGKDMLWWGLAAWLPPGLYLFLRYKPTNSNLCRSLLPAAWVLFYLFYLALMVGQKSPRFAIVVLPFLIYLVFVSLGNIEYSLARRSKQWLVMILFVVVTGTVVNAGNHSWQLGKELWLRQYSPKVMAGEWLASNIDRSSAIASDLYTYVPPEFPRHFHELYLTAYDVISKKPDYIVTSRTIMERFLDFKQRSSFREGEDAYMTHFMLYSKLNSDSFPGYELLKDFDDVMIFRKIRR